ncbi:MFS transporter [Micromonospora sp. NPDC050417]|uniref:MFS transporter n=1 Tax=Micromonospora sp. NPDC050417 TaxID=3364280 RepID=UPI0037AF3D5C
MARAGVRSIAFLLALAVIAVATVSWPLLGGTATAAPATTVPTYAPADLCTTEEWQADFRTCVDKLQEVGGSTAECLDPPTPGTPDSGLAGWFAARPDSVKEPGPRGLYSDYGYAGYSYETYDLEGGCASSVVNPASLALTKVASGELMAATAVIGASNALRERAWDPRTMWDWANPLVEQATKAVYEKVFSVFGIITLCVVGLYLLWRSRQSEMSHAMTTAGWALLVMVAVTALAAWPVQSANVADNALISSLSVVHEAVGPSTKDVPAGECAAPDPDWCVDKRPPAVRASDISTETMLYRNWLRGLLGSADSVTAKKYGEALYDAKSLTWEETERLRANPTTRDTIFEAKKNQWNKVAQQIKIEDPEAYEYLQGSRDMERIGAGFIAALAALLFALFDLTASLLVLLGFLIFRWAVIAAPVLGTVGLMRPASAGLRRLANAVVAAVFNIAIFGTGAAIYLFAVDLVMSTPTLPGWLQVVLVFLTGVVGWLLLRPYRRITQLGGKTTTRTVDAEQSWHRRFLRDLRESSRSDQSDSRSDRAVGKRREVMAEQTNLRPEARLEDPSHSADTRASERPDGPEGRPDGREESGGDGQPGRDSPAKQTAPRPRSGRGAEWTDPDVPAEKPTYVLYRPDSAKRPETTPTPTAPRIRSEAR